MEVDTSTTCSSPSFDLTKPLVYPASQEYANQFLSTIRTSTVACIGAGYVGGPTMAAIADQCPDIQVIVADISIERIELWNNFKLPFYEPGLLPLVQKTLNKNLIFTNDVKNAVESADIIFIAVNTPSKTKGSGAGCAVDLSAWEGAVRTIARYANRNKIIVEKSTVPIHTSKAVYKILKACTPDPSIDYSIVSNPEFLAEGTAVKDLLEPSRILIGGDKTPLGNAASQVVGNIYKRWVPEHKVLLTNVWSSELAKLVANAMLAQRVSSMNSIAMLCEEAGADVTEVADAVGRDVRIGPKYLQCSIGFGGSCLEKDVLSLAYISESFGLKHVSDYWRAVVEMNNASKQRLAECIRLALFNTVNRKILAVAGFSFKKNTSDVRFSPAVDLVVSLMEEGAIVHVYDPQASPEGCVSEVRDFLSRKNKVGKVDLDAQFIQKASLEEAATEAHALIIATEWDEFANYDYRTLIDKMVKPAFIFDGRSILNLEALSEMGYKCYAIGKGNVVSSSGPQSYPTDEKGAPMKIDKSAILEKPPL